MKNILKLGLFFLFGSLVACNPIKLHQETAAIFDNKQISTEELRAHNSNSRIEKEKKEQVINLKQYDDISSYTEMVEGVLKAQLELEKATPLRVSIINADGNLMHSKLQNSKAGLNEFELNFSELEIGIYYVVLISDDSYRRFCVAKTSES